jgi:hypothetical protein
MKIKPARLVRERMKAMSKKIDLNKFKDVVTQLKTKQAQLKHLVSKDTLKEAKKYAETSKAELQKLIKNTDVKKVKALIEKEAKELQKLQKNLPAEMAKFAKFVDAQKKEFEKVLKSVSALDAAEYLQKKVGLGKKSKASSGSGGAKKAASKKPKAAAPEASAEAPVQTASSEPSDQNE